MGIEIGTKPKRIDIAGYEGVWADVDMAASLDDFETIETLMATDMRAMAKGLRLFGDKFLKAWNVDIQGEPVPATGDGLVSCPLPFTLAVLTSWINEARGIPAPLGDESASGATSLGELVPMEA